ncbi:MAG: hypothetical protein JXR67_01950, partial [Bacteroidales bacterium]|nr:hypothetical protein [Bacteroidales bacterium]
GHEIGYHYEDLAVARGNFEKALSLFSENLAKLRRLVPVETICMHGSPLSKYDNRKLWEKYDYRDFSISGEPYLDIDFREVLYLTDTGRRWDGEKYSIRDRVMPDRKYGMGEDEGKAGNNVYQAGRTYFRSTTDIIRAVESGGLPSVMMITIHPQRWDNRLIPWLNELIWQNTKNVVKGFLTTS